MNQAEYLLEHTGILCNHEEKIMKIWQVEIARVGEDLIFHYLLMQEHAVI